MVKYPYRSRKCAGQTGSGPPCKDYEPSREDDYGPPDPCTICKWYFDDMYEPEDVQ